MKNYENAREVLDDLRSRIVLCGEQNKLIFHVDGSCWPNPGPGGWGVVCNDGTEKYGGATVSTNNRMEMRAVLEAIRLSAGRPCIIYTDSQYVQKGLMIWRAHWKKKDWRKKGALIPNADIWQRLDGVMRDDISVRWVRGHNGDPGNERADVLAAMGRMSIAPEHSASPKIQCINEYV